MKISNLNPLFYLLFLPDTYQFYSQVPTQCKKYDPYHSPKQGKRIKWVKTSKHAEDTKIKQYFHDSSPPANRKILSSQEKNALWCSACPLVGRPRHHTRTDVFSPRSLERFAFFTTPLISAEHL